MSALHYFTIFFISQLINDITNETKTYAVQSGDETSNVPQNDIEMVYLGCFIIMGIVKMPQMTSYWSHEFNFLNLI